MGVAVYSGASRPWDSDGLSSLVKSKALYPGPIELPHGANLNQPFDLASTLSNLPSYCKPKIPTPNIIMNL